MKYALHMINALKLNRLFSMEEFHLQIALKDDADKPSIAIYKKGNMVAVYQVVDKQRHNELAYELPHWRPRWYRETPQNMMKKVLFENAGEVDMHLKRITVINSRAVALSQQLFAEGYADLARVIFTSNTHPAWLVDGAVLRCTFVSMTGANGLTGETIFTVFGGYLEPGDNGKGVIDLHKAERITTYSVSEDEAPLYGTWAQRHASPEFPAFDMRTWAWCSPPHFEQPLNEDKEEREYAIIIGDAQTAAIEDDEIAVDESLEEYAPDEHLEAEYEERFAPDFEEYEPSPYDGTYSEE